MREPQNCYRKKVLEAVSKPPLIPNLSAKDVIGSRRPILKIIIPVLAGSSGWPPFSALIWLGPIEGFETASNYKITVR
jgi:hypothetical protein